MNVATREISPILSLVSEISEAVPRPVIDILPLRESGHSTTMDEVLQMVELVAPSAINVLLLGETGVGKEVIAHSIHDKSKRGSRPYVRINCAALPDSLFESELFGFEAGAFSGAQRSKPGLIETATGGTVLFDEVGELPLLVQAKLLRVLETREVSRLGGIRPKAVDIRIISSTNRDLHGAVEQGLFRRDLFYRLAGISILIPPLRERRDEILGLARTFLRLACEQERRPLVTLAPDTIEALLANPWHGNVRELKSAMERAVLLCHGLVVRPSDLGDHPAPAGPVARLPIRPLETLVAQPELPLQDPASGRGRPRIVLTREKMLEILNACGGNQSRAAAALGISRGTLLNRLDAFSLPRPRKRKPHNEQ